MKQQILIWMIVLLGTVGLVTAVPSVQLVDTSAVDYNIYNYVGTYNVSLPYLYNISGVVYFNETHLNATIDARNTGTDANTNCSVAGTCSEIVYNTNTSWITINQNYNTTEEMFNAIDNSTFYLASNPDGYITTDTNASTACSGGEVLYGNGTCGTPPGTAYTTGDGLNSTGTVFTHNDSSSQTDSDNSGRTYIQDILMDTFGHILNITTAVESVVDTWWTINTADFINNSDTLELNWTTINATIDDRDANTNCSIDGSCPNIAYDYEVNKTYIDQWNKTYADTLYTNNTDTNTNCSVVGSCPDVAYDTEVNKTYIDTQDSAQDECSEITGCIENAYNAEANLTGLLDDNYAPINYGDQWNKTYADTLYSNDTDTTIGNCSVDNSCVGIVYEVELNKTYVDSIAGDNSSWNKSYADILYAVIQWNKTYADTLYTNETDTTIGNCSVIGSCSDIAYDTEVNKSYIDQWNKTYADTLYTNDTDTNTNCSTAGTCTEIVYNTNTSWITINQNYNSTEDMFNAIDNGTFYLASNPSSYITTDTNASTACTGAELLYGNGSCAEAPPGVGITYANSSFDLSQLANTGNVNIGDYNFSVNDSVLFVDSTNGRVGIGTTSPFDTLHIIGDLELEHTSIEANDHAFEIDVDAAGFGDVKAIDIVYITGGISLGEDEGIILIGIDETLATGGDVFGLEVLSTEGSANIYGLKAGALVGPIHQDSGTFENMDSANNSGVDDLTNFTSSDTDSLMFVNDNDYVIIGDAAKFEELEFILNTSASNPGIKPTIEFSNGTGTWDTLVPTDGTNGMRNTGIISWEDDDIPTWAKGIGNEYLIRITRTQNSLSTIPMEDKVQISAITEYVWDKDANLRVNQINSTAFYDDGVLLTADTTIGNCSVSNSCSNIAYDTEVNKSYIDQWNKTYADTLYTNDTDTNTNCSVDNSCVGIVYEVELNKTYVDSVAGDNSSWNESYADTLYSNDTDTTIGNCSVSNSCSNIAYDTEVNKTYIDQWNKTYADTLYTNNTDTNASTECSGTTTYLDGEGNCDDISSVYADISVTGDNTSWNQSHADTLYTNDTDTDTNTNCSTAGTCTAIVYNTNTSWITINQGYNTTAQIFNAINNGTYISLAQILAFNYYNLTDFNIADYSTTAEAGALYAPITHGDEWNKTYADTLYTNNTDTNASTECSGTTTYLDGEGNCNDISSIYAPITHGDEWNKTYADVLYAVIQWNKTYADTLYTNDTDTNTNCSVANTCSAIVYSGNTSWITINQNYNTTEEIFNVVDNGTFIKTDTDTNLTEDNVEAYIFDNDNTANLNITGYNATVENLLLAGNTTFKMYANETCVVINVATTYFEVCR